MGVIRIFFRMHRWQRRALTVLVAVAVGLGAAVLLRPPIREYYLLRDLGSADPRVREGAIVRGVYLARLYPHVVKRLNDALATDDDQQFHAITRLLAALGVFRVAGRDPNQIDRLTLIEFLLTRSAKRGASQPSSGVASGPSTTSAPASPSASTATATSQASSALSGTASSPSWSASRPAASDIAADTRLLLFDDAVFVGRDNPYTRRLLAAAASDESPAIRQASAVLAARFGDANTLLKLLADADANVVEWAEVDAGISSRIPGLSVGELPPLEEQPTHLVYMKVASGWAYETAHLRPQECGPFIERVFACFLYRDGMEACQDRLLAVLMSAPDANAKKALKKAVEATELEHKYPSSMSLLAYGLVDKKGGAQFIPGVLRTATREGNWLTSQVLLAAVEAAEKLNLPVRSEVNEIVRDLWTSKFVLVQIRCQHLLSRMVEIPQPPEANSPIELGPIFELHGDWASGPLMVEGRDWAYAKAPKPVAVSEALETLRLAAMYQPPEDANDPDFALAVPSAAAAVALWVREPSASFTLNKASPTSAEADATDLGTRFDANSTAYLVYLTSCSEHQFPPDYISWHLAHSGRPEAFDLSMNLLPLPPDPRDPNSKRGFRNYSVNSRETAAMLLALSARTPEQKKAAVARITSRLEGGPLGAPTNFYEIGTYQCALMILGDANFRPNVEALLATGAFPVRRAITALCIAGASDANAARSALDWLLWDVRASTDEIADILIGTGLDEVLRVLVPDLPTVDAAAGDDLRNWQVRIMQDYYRIHREKIRFERRQ
jgi:hypothetical protein